ncbi:MAG: Dephospho-CoA kinase [Chlamydiia bacterium]|nr:Dephospho-CoA kinase [Chlamydiia bacterium]
MFPLEKIGANANIKVIGITGSISSGKSTLLEFLKKKGFATISVDNILDHLYKNNEELKAKVVDILGEDILSNQLLNKKRIAEKVFEHKKLLFKLEEITTPYVVDAIKAIAIESRNDLAVEFPLIFELNLEKLFDVTVLIKADKNLCKERSSFADFDRRHKRFMKNEEKESLADITIPNNGSIANFTKSIESSMEGII